jgi:hypothetical protein
MGLTSVANGVFVVRFVALALLPPLGPVEAADVPEAGAVTVTCCVWPLVALEIEVSETDETWFACYSRNQKKI